MSKEIINAFSASKPVQSYHVVAPDDGLPTTLNTTSGICLNLDLDPTEAEPSPQGTDFTFAFLDDDTVTLAETFADTSEPLPSFILPDGARATTKDLPIDIYISSVGGASAAITVDSNRVTDIIYGGQGSDVMCCGEDKDTFAWTNGDLDSSHDQIMDLQYTMAGYKLQFGSLLSEGDLDIEDLLGVHSPTAEVVYDKLVLAAM